MRGMVSVLCMPWLQQEDMFDGDEAWGEVEDWIGWRKLTLLQFHSYQWLGSVCVVERDINHI